MPYSKPSDLPVGFHKYSEHGKTAAVAAFNHALKEYGDEGTAFAVAHTAAKRAESAPKPPKATYKPKLY